MEPGANSIREGKRVVHVPVLQNPVRGLSVLVALQMLKWHTLQPVGFGYSTNEHAPTITHRLKRVPLNAKPAHFERVSSRLPIPRCRRQHRKKAIVAVIAADGKTPSVAAQLDQQMPTGWDRFSGTTYLCLLVVWYMVAWGWPLTVRAARRSSHRGQH